MELDILITLLKTDTDLDNTWLFDGSNIIFYNNHNKKVADAFLDDDSYINVSGCICNDEYNGFENLTASEVYSRWANYVMTED